MAKYVYSSLTNSQIYSTDVGDIFIAGGANCTNKYMIIDRAVVTPVTDSQAAALTKCEAFLRHQKRGFLKIVNSKEDVELTRLKTTFPNLRMVSSSEFKGANAGDDAVYMIIEKAMIDDGSTDGGEAIIQVVPTKYMMLGSEQQIKGYVEDATNALAGVFVKRPWLVSRGSIPA